MAHAHVLERARIGNLFGFSLSKTLEGGAMAGMIGGLYAAIWWMAYSLFTGYGFLFPFRLLGGTFGGPEAMVGGAGVVLMGVGVHLGMSMFLGIVYAFLVTPRIENLSSVFGGVVYGMAVLAVMTTIVTPWANPVLHDRVSMMPASWFIMHAVFGFGVALVPILERHLGRGEKRQEPQVPG